LAVTLNRLNRTPEAVQMLEKAISLQPKYASPYYNLAIFLCKQGECYRAEQTMRKFLELETSGPRAEQAQSLLRPNFSINPGHLDKRGKEIAAFARYGIVRGEWILEKHRQQDPGAKSYEPSLEEEVDALSQQATAWRESKRLDARLKEPELDRLLHIADSGHLEAFAAWSFCSQHPQRCTDAQRSSEAVRRLNQWAAANSVELKPIQQRGVLNWMGRKWD
jgi:tetratricopeptide (TPR) repeat protein